MGSEESHVTKTTLKKSLGFSDKLIKELLPDPIVKDNPIYKRASPMQLWRKDDVERAMESREYLDHMKKRKSRTAAAAKGVETKRKRTMEHLKERIATIKIEEPLPRDKLENLAKQSHHEWRVIKGDYYDDSCSCTDEETVERWMVNYVRHELLDYDIELKKFFGQVGTDEVYIEYKNAVLEAIASAYPYLRDACMRQIGTLEPLEDRRALLEDMRSENAQEVLDLVEKAKKAMGDEA